MPFKSAAQKKKFGELVSQGKVSKSTFDEWNSKTPNSIPERVSPKTKTMSQSQYTKWLKKRIGK